jgi:hypothetical protein
VHYWCEVPSSEVVDHGLDSGLDLCICWGHGCECLPIGEDELRLCILSLQAQHILGHD